MQICGEPTVGRSFCYFRWCHSGTLLFIVGPYEPVRVDEEVHYGLLLAFSCPIKLAIT